jgi:phage shock protein PspC (stress-responsive transcriptional regulator)
MSITSTVMVTRPARSHIGVRPLLRGVAVRAIFRVAPDVPAARTPAIMAAMTTTTDTDPNTPPPPPAPPSRPRLERSRTDRYVSGVCGGLGRYLDIDPVIVRVAIACFAIFGAGLILYAVAWAFVPEEGRAQSIALAAGGTVPPVASCWSSGSSSSPASWPWTGFSTAATAVTSAGCSAAPDRRIVLVAPRQRRNRAAAAPPPAPWPGQPAPPPTAPPAPSAFWAATATTSPAPSAPIGPPSDGPARAWAWQPAPATASKPTPERSQLGVLTISALLIVLGVASLVDATDAFDVSPQGVLASALVVVGAGLLVGAKFGRSRGLIALGLLLTLATSLVRAVDIPLQGATGDVRWEVTSTDQLRSRYSLRAGTAVLDLTDLEFGEPRTIDVAIGAGEFTILVPVGVTTRVKGHLVAGEADIFGTRYGGIDIDFNKTESSTPTLTINTRLGLGDLQVRHEEA